MLFHSKPLSMAGMARLNHSGQGGQDRGPKHPSSRTKIAINDNASFHPTILQAMKAQSDASQHSNLSLSQG